MSKLCQPYGKTLKYITRITHMVRIMLCFHDDVIKWKHFPRYWAFVRGIYRPPVDSPTKARDAELCCFLDLRLNKRLSKQSRHRWFETPLRSLWRHCNSHSYPLLFEVSIKSFYHLSHFPNSCMVYNLNRIIIVYVISSTIFLNKIFLETYFHIRVILSTAWWCIVFETRSLIYTYLNLLQNIFTNKCTKCCFSVFICLKGNAQYSLIKSGAAITRFNIARTCVQHSTAMTKIKHRSRFNIIISTPYLTVTTNIFILHKNDSIFMSL